MGYNYIQADNEGNEENVTTSVNSNYTLYEYGFLENYNDKTFISKLPAIVYTAIMMTVGLLGNMVVFYIYFFKWRRSTSRIFILYLAALDMINCATTMPMEIYIMRFSFKMDHSCLCKVARYATYVMNSSSALILIGIATDRYTRICRPYQKLLSEAISKRICIAAILISLGTTWPSLFLYGIRKVNLEKAHGLSCLLENQYDVTPYPMIYFCYMISSTLLIFAVITILYYFIGVQIYHHSTFKFKNCTHVEKVFEDKSISLKLEITNHNKARDAASREYLNENQKETINNEVFMEANEERPRRYYENIQMPIQVELHIPSNHRETSCVLVNFSSNNNGKHIRNDNELIGVHERGETNVNKATPEHSSEINQPPPVVKQSPRRQKPSDHTRTKVVRYQIVRGSSTTNAYGKMRCTSCYSTVRIGRSTLILFMITIAYILSFLPFYIIAIIRQTDSTIPHGLTKTKLVVYHVFLRSYLLSSAINPFIYSFCNKQFREHCKCICVRVLQRIKRTLTDTLMLP